MGSESSLLCLALLLAFSSTIHAFNVTKLLGEHPEFSNFNRYLTETKLAEQINKRNTITVLAVENGAISSIAGKSAEAIKAIISTHVILDYFDEKKLMEAHSSGQPLTTLYQTSGHAVNKQGFIKVSLIGEGGFGFGSAVSGSPIDSELVRTVTTQPYNISILQITKPIIFPGADSKTPGAQPPTQSAPPPTQSAKAPAPSSKAPLPSSKSDKAPSPSLEADAPSPSQRTKAPSKSPGAKAPAPQAKAPASSSRGKAPAPSPSDDSTAESPKDAADAPESIASSPPEPELAPGPVGDEEVAADAPSTASTTHITLFGAVMAFASLFIVL